MSKKDEQNINEEGENVIEITEEQEDVVFEEELSDSDGVKKLREKIKRLTEEKQEYLNGWQRSQADMANLKKQHIEQQKLFTSLGKESLVQELVPMLDNFEAAFSNKEVWQSVDENWRMGIEYIYTQFVQTLENNGVLQFGAVGEKINHNLHENLEGEGEKISEVVQKGYKMGEKILRAAKVKTI